MPFPYEEDRALIEIFLRRDASAIKTDGRESAGETITIAVKGGVEWTLRKLQGGVAVAYFAPDDALMGIYTPSSPYSGQVINYLAQTLGSPDHLTREFRGDDAHLSDRKQLAFFGDQPVTEGVPFVIAGPLITNLYRMGVKI